MKLRGKVAVVTGGCSGIGKAAAELFSSEGAKVAVIDKAAWPKKSTRTMGGFLRLKGDVTKETEVKRLMAQAWRSFGKIDILLNNAGVYFNKDLIRCSLREWNAVLSHNLTPAFLCARHVLPYMLKSKGGSIINISSSDAIVGDGGASAYCAAKGGVLSFSRALARELARHNVRVNSIAPGPVVTPMFRLHNSLRETLYIKKRVPLGRLGTVDDIAAGALFLASQDSGYITGQVLIIDGGTI